MFSERLDLFWAVSLPGIEPADDRSRAVVINALGQNAQSAQAYGCVARFRTEQLAYDRRELLVKWTGCFFHQCIERAGRLHHLSRHQLHVPARPALLEDATQQRLNIGAQPLLRSGSGP